MNILWIFKVVQSVNLCLTKFLIICHSLSARRILYQKWHKTIFNYKLICSCFKLCSKQVYVYNLSRSSTRLFRSFLSNKNILKFIQLLLLRIVIFLIDFFASYSWKPYSSIIYQERVQTDIINQNIFHCKISVDMFDDLQQKYKIRHDLVIFEICRQRQIKFWLFKLNWLTLSTLLDSKDERIVW